MEADEAIVVARRHPCCLETVLIDALRFTLLAHVSAGACSLARTLSRSGSKGLATGNGLADAPADLCEVRVRQTFDQQRPRD